MAGLLFGLGAAVCWGSADVIATVVSRRAGPLRAQLAMQGIGAALLTPFLVFVPIAGHVGAGRAAAFLLVGAVAAGSFLAFFAALRQGPIALVSPIVSAYAAVVLLLAVWFLGERPSGLQLAGITCTVVGVILASTDLRRLRSIRLGRGILLSLVTMVGFGVVLFFVGQQVRELSWFLPAYLLRLCTLPPLVAISAARREWPWQAATAAMAGLMIALAALDSVGSVSFGVGTHLGFTSIVATAASAYSLVPIAAGVLWFGERFAPNQAVGIASVIAGLVVLGLAA